jgi:elongation factor G
VDAIRNIGIVAHIDAGKTTLTEQLLVLTGFLRSPGSVEDGTTVADWRRPERERGITIGSAAVTSRWRDHEVTIVDTPGHVDFTLEVERTLTVIEGIVLVLSAPDGVQAQTQAVWDQAAHHALPAMAFVNKLDRPGVDDLALQAEIRERLGLEPVPLQVLLVAEPDCLRLLDLVAGEVLEWRNLTARSGPRQPARRAPAGDQEEFELFAGRERLADAVSPWDDALTEMVLDDREPTEADWRRAIRAAVRARGCLPLVYGVARAGAGAAQLLDAVVAYLPSPAQAPARPIFGCDPDGVTATWPPDSPQPPTAFVFKTEWRGRDRRVAWIRVFSGTIGLGRGLSRPADPQPVDVAELARLVGGTEEPIAALEDGTIGAIVGQSGQRFPMMGDTLVDGPVRWVFEPVAVPAPVIAVALEAPDADGQAAIQRALDELVTDDPSLAVMTDPLTGQTLLLGMGELHLELVAEELVRDRALTCRVGPARVHLRRTIAAAAEGVGTSRDDHDRDGEVTIRVRLAPTDLSGVAQIAALPAHELDAAAATALSAGLRHVLVDLEDLVQARLEVLEIRATGSSAQPPRSYWDAGVAAAHAAILGARSQPAEPWVAAEVTAPDEAIGRVTGDLAKRRARIHGATSRGAVQQLAVTAPMAEMLSYATDLRSMTSGRGSFSMRPIGYRPC